MSRLNNYDFLRIIAAVSVIISHQFALFGLPEPLVFRYQTLGGFGVLVFFSISGYLIGQSWDSDPNFFRFSVRRMLRIWPAYAGIIFICLFVVGPIFTTDPLQAYFSNPVTWDYLKNLFFIFRPFLPGVFAESPVAYVPNGVYWTLPLEVGCYALVALLGVVGVMRSRWLLFFITMCVAYWYYVSYDAQSAILNGGERYYFVQYGTFFFYGVLLSKFKDFWLERRAGALIFLSCLSAVLYLCGEGLLALFVVMPFLINAFGEYSTSFINRFGRFGDPSYGLYIFAFPIQQITLTLLGREDLFAEKLIFVILLSLCLSYASWHFLEKPILKFKPKRA